MVSSRVLAWAITVTVIGSAVVAPVGHTTPAPIKPPAWISIESPPNPAESSFRGAAFLVHAFAHGGSPTTRDVTGTVEGLVNGSRRSMPLQLKATNQPGVFAVQRQWPAEGTWMIRINSSSTTALVPIGRDGNLAGVVVPTSTPANAEMPIPRAVSAREIDDMLAGAARQ